MGRCDSRTGDSHSPSYTELKKTTLRQRAGRGPAGLERPSWGRRRGWRRGRGAEAACGAASPSAGREAGECGCRKSADGSRHPRAARTAEAPASPRLPRILASCPPSFSRQAIGALGPSLCAGPHCPERLVDATVRVLSPVCCARPPHCPERRARRSAGQGAPLAGAAGSRVCPAASAAPPRPPADRACLSLASLLGGPWCLIAVLMHISLMADDLDLRLMSHLPSVCIFGEVSVQLWAILGGLLDFPFFAGSWCVVNTGSVSDA